MTGGKMLCFLVPIKQSWLCLFLQLAENIINISRICWDQRAAEVGGALCEMRPGKLSAQSFRSSWPSAHIWFLGAWWINCADPTVAGLAVWAASLERKPKSGKPHPLGEPLHHSPLPEPSPAREGCDLRGRVQTSSQWAYAACCPAHSWACAGQSANFLLRVSAGGKQLSEIERSNWFQLPSALQVDTHQFSSVCRATCKPQLSSPELSVCMLEHVCECVQVCVGDWREEMWQSMPPITARSVVVIL